MYVSTVIVPFLQKSVQYVGNLKPGKNIIVVRKIFLDYLGIVIK
jgi:hypothetical protein